ncbi:rod-determining factor RdfA [Halorubrum sp. CSM-61]|uniref:rod-determining factor RdfA n=1 Tax=Halorubrum sp. CSM-61 TaxID=2485838 RepID=UPI000F4BF859|nr:rod-determining factor RdfA [Halorubrum sp. CSM-61]
MADPNRDSSGPGRESKVARLLRERELEPLGDELEHLWTRAEDRRSLRELADHFNRELLRSALREAETADLDGAAANYYRLLTDDDVSPGDRVEATRWLERAGVDVERLRGEFVSYQAVRTYLKDYRNAEYERNEGDRVGREAESIRQFSARTEAIVQDKIDRLRSRGHLAVGDPSVTVQVRVYCSKCNSQHSVDRLLERGRCDCSTA